MSRNNQFLSLVVVANVFNPGTLEAEAGRTLRVHDQSCLQREFQNSQGRETLSQKNNQKTNKQQRIISFYSGWKISKPPALYTNHSLDHGVKSQRNSKIYLTDIKL